MFERWASSSTGCRNAQRWRPGWTRRVNRCGWCRPMAGFARAGRLRVEEGFTHVRARATSGAAACRIWPTRSICGRIRSSWCCGTSC